MELLENEKYNIYSEDFTGQALQQIRHYRRISKSEDGNGSHLSKVRGVWGGE